jgi:hypothetical protein
MCIDKEDEEQAELGDDLDTHVDVMWRRPRKIITSFSRPISNTAPPYIQSHISLTTAALTLKPQSDTMHLTCSSKFTVMPLTSPSPRLSYTLGVTSTLATKQIQQPSPDQWPTTLSYNSTQTCGIFRC